MKLIVYPRIVLAIAVFGLAILWGGLLSLFGVDQDRIKGAVSRVMADWICRMARLHVTISGAEKLGGAGPAVVVGNQQSNLCYCIYAKLFRVTPNSGVVARLTGKWNLPVVSWLFRRTGNFMVDPRNPIRTAVGFVDARTALTNQAGRVWIGPEGTRWKDPGILGPFKRGAFLLAIEAGVPIVPIVISPLKPTTDLWAGRLDHNEVEMRVLDPVSTDGMESDDLPFLRDEVRSRMQKVLDEMSKIRSVG